MPIIDDTVPDNGETFKLVLSNASGAKLGDAEAVGTILNTETPVLTGFTLVNAETGSDIGAIEDSGVLTLDDPANGSYGLVAAVASDAGVGSVRLALTGAKTVTATDDAAPWSLYGGANGQVQGEGLPAGSYTLSATAYAEAGGGGAELGTLSVSFSVAASEAVAPDALTASFTVVPAAHEGPGSGAFVLELQFSEEPELSYSVLRNESLAAKDGSLGFVRRLNPPLSAGWKIKVRPSGWDDVTVTLAGGRACGTEGAVCTKDGKVLANTAVATVPGPLALSVADARIDEAPNAVLAFEVTLNRAAGGTVTVGYATADSTATAGADYTATSGTLTFAAGETSRTVNVAVLDDAHDEGEETMKLLLSNPSGARIRDGEATGTIENTDAIPKAWIARFGRTVTGQVLDAVEARLVAPRTAGVQASLAGQALPSWDGSKPAAANDNAAQLSGADERQAMDAIRSWMKGAGATDGEGNGGAVDAFGRPEAESRALTARDFVTGTSFALTGGGREAGGFASLWGRGGIASFNGREGELTLDGEVTTGLIGADWASERWTAGLAVGHSRGTGGYRMGGCTEDNCAGEMEATLTGVYPYAGMKLTERLSAWAAAGYGSGDLTVTPREREAAHDRSHHDDGRGRDAERAARPGGGKRSEAGAQGRCAVHADLLGGGARRQWRAAGSGRRRCLAGAGRAGGLAYVRARRGRCGADAELRAGVAARRRRRRDRLRRGSRRRSRLRRSEARALVGSQGARAHGA